MQLSWKEIEQNDFLIAFVVNVLFYSLLQFKMFKQLKKNLKHEKEILEISKETPKEQKRTAQTLPFELPFSPKLEEVS